MTVSSEVNYISYAGTGAQTVFPYPFKIYAASDLKVYLRAANLLDTLLVLNTHYTVDGAGVEGGGNVTLVTAPAAVEDLLIFRDPPVLQGQEYVEGGELPAVSHEDSLDKVVMQVQALSARAVKTPESGAQLDVALPSPAVSTDGLFVRWNAAGTALEAVASTPVYLDGCPLEMVNALDYGDGTVSHATLAAAVAAIGAEERRLYLRRGTWNITANLTMLDNITLVPERGAVLKPADGVTLTIQGECPHGPWQVFDWAGTGAIDLSASPTVRWHLEAWGAVSGVGNDVAAALAKAYASLGAHQEIWLGRGIYRLASTVTVPAVGTLYPPDLVGADPIESIFFPDVGSGNDGLVIGATGNTVYGAWIRNVNVAGEASCCKTALKLIRWNHGGAEMVNIICGAVENGAQLLGPENCDWDFRLGHYASRVTALGITYGMMQAGVYAAADGGYGKTYNKIRVLKSNTLACVRGLYINGLSDWIVEEGDLENCVLGEVDYNCAGTLGGSGADQASLYTGGDTRIAQVFTVTAPAVIANVGFFLRMNNAKGNITAKLYNTAAGAPNGAALVASETLQASRLNSGGVPWPTTLEFPGQGYTLAPGTYAVSLEFDSGDVTHYVAVDTDVTAGHAGGCYTYDGAWNLEAYDLRFGLNVAPAAHFYNCSRLRIKKLHCEMNYWDLLVDKCSEVHLDNMATIGGARSEIRRSQGVTIGGDSIFGDLRIDPLSSVTVGSIQLSASWFTDYGNTNYLGRIYDWVTYRAAAGVKGNNLANYINNHLLIRWQATHADGWTKDAAHTWTQTGVGLVDTNRHAAKYAAQIVVTADSSLYLNLTDEQLNALRGKWGLFSLWLMFPSGQTWGANSHFLQFSTTLPAWVGATAYQVGDGVSNGGVKLYCVKAGTSDVGAPANPASREYVVDGTVLWLRWDNLDLSGGVIDDSMSNDEWRRWSVAQFIPPNITSANIRLALYVQTGPVDTTFYLAEPALNIGFVPSGGVLPGIEEHESNIFLAGTRITAAAAMPAAGFNREGDIVINNGASALDVSSMFVLGWFRLTTGSNHVSGTDWAIMNISHVSPAT